MSWIEEPFRYEQVADEVDVEVDVELWEEVEAAAQRITIETGDPVKITVERITRVTYADFLPEEDREEYLDDYPYARQEHKQEADFAAHEAIVKEAECGHTPGFIEMWGWCKLCRELTVEKNGPWGLE